MITQMVYPDGAVHVYEYDLALGRLEQIKAVTDVEEWQSGGSNPYAIVTFVTGLTYTASGVVTKMNYANRTYQTWEFDNRKRISQIRLSQISGSDMRNTYGGIGVGTLISLASSKLPEPYSALGIVIGSGVAALSAAIGDKLK